MIIIILIRNKPRPLPGIRLVTQRKAEWEELINYCSALSALHLREERDVRPVAYDEVASHRRAEGGGASSCLRPNADSTSQWEADEGQTEVRRRSDWGQMRVRRVSDGGQTEVRRGSDGGQTRVRRGSDGGQTEVRRGSDEGQTEVRRRSDEGQTEVRRGSDEGQTKVRRGSRETRSDTTSPSPTEALEEPGAPEPGGRIPGCHEDQNPLSVRRLIII